MKLRSLLIFAFFGLGLQLSFGQARLSITSLANFPVASQDTAYDIQSYDSVTINISNTGNQTFTGAFDVLVQGNPGVTDTIYSDSSATLQIFPGDSVIARPLPYQFDLTHYDDGDNIVVVWPAARTAGVQSDTLTVHVYFVRLSGIEEPGTQSILAYPNPAVQFIRLESSPDNDVKYVRIIDLKGAVLYYSTVFKSYLDVSQLSPGNYLIELGRKNGKSRFAKIIKE
ncbi:MAG: T9SS type A sorting domain-containing protein [Bacteroidetes bacterium]|nr:T9SS type A sorting domain-containing protein [Bacteroidota bacterium]MBL0064465.1 T9SS type A sorting domain-containing protein [Bacteroidota bacterium]MBL0137610.1 T9SS type A sorting domain-containing protein [Bacteroidota bacterium]